MFTNSNPEIYIIHPDRYALGAEAQAALLLIANISEQDPQAAQYLLQKLVSALLTQSNDEPA
jgi:hypothetical protein